MTGVAHLSERVAVPPEVGVLAPFVEARVFGAFEVQLATTMVRLQPGISDEVVLALALAARAPRFGHVCVELGQLQRQIVDVDEPTVGRWDLPWPSPDEWARALADSTLVSQADSVETERVRPLVWDGKRVYLQRYWHYEMVVARDLLRRVDAFSPTNQTSRPDAVGAIEAVLGGLFDRDDEGPNFQQEAVRLALTSGVSIIAGGPGTGKTQTVARLMAAAHLVAATDGREVGVALAAPTGKAAQRMRDAVQGVAHLLEQSGAISPAVAQALTTTDATTIHRLLGWLPSARFEHDRHNPLPHQLVIIDETSMVSLPLMARLLDAVRPEARLVLVGDPNQLASVEAGTVLGDVVGPPGSDPGEARQGFALADQVTVLRRMYRFGAESAIAALAEAIRTGDVDLAIDLLTGSRSEVTWVRDIEGDAVDEVRNRVVEAGIEVVTAATRGDAEAALAAATRIKVLTGTRRGPFGLYDWGNHVEAAVGSVTPRGQRARRWRVGRPIIVTANDPVNRVSNGDIGVVVSRDGGVEVAMPEGAGIRFLAPSRLELVETWWAMTIHKSQGSEFPHAVVSLPHAESPVLSRELLYTAVTRAKEQLTVVGSEDSVRAAIARPIARASGLRDRLWT